MLLAVSDIESLLLRQCFANLFITVTVILVGDSFAVVIYSVEYDVAVRMLMVSVTGYDELCITDAHSLHIVVSNFYHQTVIISQAGTILWRETEGDMPDGILHLFIEYRLQLKLLRHFFGSTRYALGYQQPCLVLTK